MKEQQSKMKRWIGRFSRRGIAHQGQEPGVALFRGIRIRMTLWYCSVLGAALIIFGLALYFGTQFALLQPVQADTRDHALVHARQWRINATNTPTCPDTDSAFGQSPGSLPDQGSNGSMPEIIACFDNHGTLLPSAMAIQLPTAFLDNHLAIQALQSSKESASDTVNGGSVGRIARFAQVVHDNNGRILGVLVAGEYLKAQDEALATLMMLLLSIGSGAMLLAGLGGLFLSNRALAPARLAWARQQRFIADASHELRTPLTLLRADAEVLLRGREGLNEEDAGLLEDIVLEAKHMAKITTNLLTLARLDNQQSHREHEVVLFDQLAHQIVGRVQALANQRGITLDEDYAGHPRVIGDPTQLEEAVLVLLDNAIKYNRSGGSVHVHATVLSEQVQLVVQDSGIGITQEHMPYLGERFYRVDKARSRAAGGTGLGLSIARSIALNHGGQLSLASQPGQGTTATLILPLALETHET